MYVWAAVSKQSRNIRVRESGSWRHSHGWALVGGHGLKRQGSP